MTMDGVLEHPFFGIILSVAAYAAGQWLRRKTGSVLANPLLVATALIVATLHLLPISMRQYRAGGSIITLLILPATTALAVHMDRAWGALRANILPILGSCAIGSATSIGSVYFLCRWFGIDAVVTTSLLPKSVTTAISIDLSESTGGIVAITVSAVILTGIFCAVLSPLLVSLFSLKDSVATGLAFGVSGHAIGTARSLEIGETEGAFSGIALGLSGILTSVLYFLYQAIA